MKFIKINHHCDPVDLFPPSVRRCSYTLICYQGVHSDPFSSFIYVHDTHANVGNYIDIYLDLYTY